MLYRFKQILVIGLCSLSFIASAFAMEVKVGLEIFPPLITAKKGGYTIDMLKAVENFSDLKFTIILMTYNRAKTELKNNRIDMMGHTALDLENEEFYQYARNIRWSIPTKADIFAMDEHKVKPEVFIKLKRIGVPFGNKEVQAGYIGCHVDQFLEARTVDDLVQMLKS